MMDDPKMRFLDLRLIGYYMKTLTTRTAFDLHKVANMIEMKRQEIVLRNMTPPTAGEDYDPEKWREFGVGPAQMFEDEDFLEIASALETFLEEEFGVTGDELILFLDAAEKVFLFRRAMLEDHPKGMPTIDSTQN